MLFTIVSRWLGLRLDALTACIVGASAIASVYAPREQAGMVGVVLAQVMQLSGVLQYAVRQAAETQNLMLSVERIMEYDSVAPEAPAIIPGRAPARPWPAAGVIEFRDVAMAYAPGAPLALRRVAFATRPCEKIGIVGRTGSGKSSLGFALFRVVEVAVGQVVVDGVDLARIGLRDVRTACCIIPQNPMLFSGTIRSNLDPLDENTDETLWDALRRVNLVEYIHRLPLQLGTPVVENGVRLASRARARCTTSCNACPSPPRVRVWRCRRTSLLASVS